MKRTYALSVLLLLLVGCSSPPDTSCEDVTVEGDTYCVYHGPITETGYDCPPDMPNMFRDEMRELVACSSAEERPPFEAIEAAMDEQSQNMNNPPNNSDNNAAACVDADGDGFGVGDTSLCPKCVDDGLCDEDCDDDEATVFPDGDGHCWGITISGFGDGENCSTYFETNLPGVEISFDLTECSWTQAELANGVTIDYSVIVDEDIQVRPEAQGTCATLGPSGLAPFEEITGNGQNYCLCDSGLCPPLDEEVTLEAGITQLGLEWDGRNWEGPSDTNNPKGDPFPPGTYEVKVSAVGTHANLPYEVFSTMQIEITE